MFNFSFDKRTMYIIVGIMLLFVVIQYAANPTQLIGLLISAPGVLIAITFHEFAHGYAAYKLDVTSCRIWLGKTSRSKPKKLYQKNLDGKRRSNSISSWTNNEFYISNNLYTNILCNI